MLKQLFKKRHKKNPALKKLNFDKHNFYTFNGDIIEESFTKRYLKYIQVVESHELFKLDKGKRDTILTEIENCIDNGQISKISQWVGLLKSLDQLSFFEEEVFAVINCFLLLEGEPLDDFSMEHTKRKRELFDNDESVRVFFCAFAEQYMTAMATALENTSVYDYLKTQGPAITKKMYDHLTSQLNDKKSGTS